MVIIAFYIIENTDFTPYSILNYNPSSNERIDFNMISLANFITFTDSSVFCIIFSKDFFSFPIASSFFNLHLTSPYSISVILFTYCSYISLAYSILWSSFKKISFIEVSCFAVCKIIFCLSKTSIESTAPPTTVPKPIPSIAPPPTIVIVPPAIPAPPAAIAPPPMYARQALVNAAP